MPARFAPRARHDDVDARLNPAAGNERRVRARRPRLDQCGGGGNTPVTKGSRNLHLRGGGDTIGLDAAPGCAAAAGHVNGCDTGLPQLESQFGRDAPAHFLNDDWEGGRTTQGGNLQ